MNQRLKKVKKNPNLSLENRKPSHTQKIYHYKLTIKINLINLGQNNIHTYTQLGKRENYIYESEKFTKNII